jgi:HK97 family phage prohead protease
MSMAISRRSMLAVTQEIQHRSFSELRAATEGRKLVGVAASYNTRTVINTPGEGRFIEQIAPGAFRGILSKSPDVVFTYNHNADSILGRTTSGTLRLNEDSRGLGFELDLPDTTLGKDVYESVKRGDLNSCSFAFTADKDDSDWSDEEVEGRAMAVRTLRNFSGLYDISAVIRSAYTKGTEIHARSLEFNSETAVAEAEELEARNEATKRMQRLEAELNPFDADAWMQNAMRRSAKVAEEISRY